MNFQKGIAAVFSASILPSGSVGKRQGEISY